MLPRLPALTWRLPWMTSPLPPYPPLHPHASGLRSRTVLSLSPYKRELLSPATFSRTFPKPSSSRHSPNSLCQLGQDSPLTMSKAKYKKARSTINRLLSDLMAEDSDDDI